MAVPKKHTTKSRRNRRRMHIYIKPTNLSFCPKCKKANRPHTLCQNCGYYKGRLIIDVLAKLTKKERKQKEKEMAGKEKDEQSQKKTLSWEEMSKR